MRMDAGDDQVHFVQHFAGKIQFTIGEDIYFDSREYADVLDSFVGLADLANVLDSPFVVQSVSKCEVLGVVGNGHVFVAAFTSGSGHLFDRAATVGLDRVHVNVAANVAQFDQPRKSVLLGGLDLSLIFAKLRRNVVQF